ncbi:hypothetical protein [Acinetobacter boissieri]|uniref:Uncharacterized protein n=1 Tax=Acinetobacter boissieri TaxID=1219383 RepID=A0A1G6GYB0_9GAMM|nr:hypothetical protein [Acinetobacter boissieri]SDB86868.1 hypothetical protein SAMN05421733_10314 [Acinetobacter boissieri]
MIVSADVISMINHWLSTPPNGYFGSSYGADLNGLLLRPMTSDVANTFIAKMKEDLPILAQLHSDQLSLYTENISFEQKKIYLGVGNININLTDIQQMQS